jgi:hypothetical protein
MLICAGAINETFFRATVESLAARGFLESGYEYINLDDCWMDTKRDANGDLQWGPNFPTGHTLGDFIHSKGFKFGVRPSEPAPLRCQPASGETHVVALHASEHADVPVRRAKDVLA